MGQKSYLVKGGDTVNNLLIFRITDRCCVGSWCGSEVGEFICCSLVCGDVNGTLVPWAKMPKVDCTLGTWNLWSSVETRKRALLNAGSWTCVSESACPVWIWCTHWTSREGFPLNFFYCVLTHVLHLQLEEAKWEIFKWCKSCKFWSSFFFFFTVPSWSMKDLVL